ncbi:hypothetical protein NPIL_21101 [Nephila pilipes]|uniref:Uncharacterized protein n=1 Tax=Nephila pilipes TaxID=299642 RepID=A0A8X6MKR1_NEPPI|nr:hypothetical protein NPIL_343531 [Nephila pilipes]GFT44619.1 hypothetical protein NPIL_76381 [Nephila pilipes]GFT50309.1 hypothetical protein NPIL_21101 [Nephila pilipes]
MVIWKGGKSITVNVDQIWIYHPRERDEGVVGTNGLNGERSRAEQVESEYSKGLARESSKKEKWRGKVMMSEESTESCNDRKGRHQSERRSPGRMNGRKCPGIRMTSREV